MARQGTAKQALEAQKQEQINAPAPATPPTTPTPAVPNPQDTLTGSGVASDRVKAVVSARTQALPPNKKDIPAMMQKLSQVSSAPTEHRNFTQPAKGIIAQELPATRKEGQWNYGTAENPVYAQTPQAPEAKPAPTQPVTTEVGREQAFGQLAKQPEAQTRQAELKSVRENLKDDSGKQLWDNLQSISANNPNLLQDRNAYNQAFGYNGKDAGEKAMVDSYWRSTRPKSEDIYRSLEAGQGVPQRSLGTSEAVEAIERKSELTKYENLNPYQLSKLIGSELIPGSQVYNDLSAKNPSLITNATKLAQINLPVTNQIAPKTNWQDAISQMMQKSPTMQDPMTVEKIMNSDPAISQKTNEVNQYDNQINELTQQQKNLLANITERYKGTGASKATINARYLSESRDLTDQLALLTAQKNSASLALTTLIQNGKDNYEMARQSRLDAEASYYKNMDAMMQMAQMGMQQENLEYQRAQQAIERDLQQMQYWQQREDGFVKDELSFERDLYKTKVTQEYQMQMDERNFNQQKELARMGYQNQRDMANLGFEQDLRKIREQQRGVVNNTTIGGGQTIVNQADRDMFVADFIKGKEGFRENAYLDSAGKPTVGYGFTSINGVPVKMGDTITREQADTEFAKQVARYQNFKKFITTDLSPEQEAALTSFEFNLGSGIWQKNAMGIIDAVNNGNLQQASNLMQAYNKAGGKYVQGLQNRRIEEGKMIMKSSTAQSQTSIDPAVAGFVDAWDKGTMDIETILTKAPQNIRGQIMSVIQSRGGTPYRSETDPAVVSLRNTASMLDSLIQNKEQLENVSGGIQASPWDSMTKKKQDYLANVQNILDGGVIQELIDAKASGATFGALSNEELKMLQAAASPLSNAAKRKDGRIVGFEMTEKEFATQLGKLLTEYNQKIARMTGNSVGSGISQPQTTQGASTAGGSTTPGSTEYWANYVINNPNY